MGQGTPLLQPRAWLGAQNPAVRFSIIGFGAFAAITLAVAIFNTIKKSRSPHARRKQAVNKNKVAVEGIDAYLPERRGELTTGSVPNPT